MAGEPHKRDDWSPELAELERRRELARRMGVDLRDQFGLPVANFVDQSGFLIGTAAERSGTIRRGTRALYAVHQATVPWASILVCKVYGVAGAGHGDGSRLNLRYGWPSGDWGSLPLAGGIEAAIEPPSAIRLSH